MIEREQCAAHQPRPLIARDVGSIDEALGLAPSPVIARAPPLAHLCGLIVRGGVCVTAGGSSHQPSHLSLIRSASDTAP